MGCQSPRTSSKCLSKKIHLKSIFGVFGRRHWIGFLLWQILYLVLSGWACLIKSVCSSVCTRDSTFSRGGDCTSGTLTFDSEGESNTGFEMHLSTWTCTLCKAGIVIEALETWRVVSCDWSLCSPDVQVLPGQLLQWGEFYLCPAGMWNEQIRGARLSQKKVKMLLKLGATVFMYSKKMGSATDLWEAN